MDKNTRQLMIDELKRLIDRKFKELKILKDRLKKLLGR